MEKEKKWKRNKEKRKRKGENVSQFLTERERSASSEGSSWRTTITADL